MSSVRAALFPKFSFVACLVLLLSLSSIPTVDARLGVAGPNLVGKRGGFSFNRAERCLMVRINRIRARHGLRRLERDKQMGYVARNHARTMGSSRGVWHDPDLGWEITRWRRLGQNTGRGRGCRSLTRSFMRSSSHRAQILGRFRFFAVGAERTAGKLYVQEIFESRLNPGNAYSYP